MSTGISIKKATYGVGSTTVDATAGVTSQDKDGVINFSVSPSSLGVDDPAPGQPKTLNVTYTINNGNPNTASVKDGNALYIDAPPARTADGLQITKAMYGYAGNYADVTNAVQDQVANGSISLKVGFKAVGIPDPNPNKPKDLQVEYTINGAKGSQNVADGTTFSLSAPPLVGSQKKPLDQGMELIGGITNAVWLFVKLTLFFSLILLSWTFGNRVIKEGAGGFVMAVLSFISFGIFPLFGLPFVIFWWRLFVNHDLYNPSIFIQSAM
jgi:hypothetical protein